MNRQYYRKRPVIIEAVRLDPWNVEDVAAWCGGVSTDKSQPLLHIDTLEGRMNADHGDFIIKGIKGEFYPVKPDIFEQTYEETTMTIEDVRYPPEVLDGDEDDGTMPESLEALRQAVVGHRIVSVEKKEVPRRYGSYYETVITLDNGQQVRMVENSDCCAYTELEAFLLHPELVDHMILGVGTTDGYTKWHIFADAGDVLELTVGWSCGNPFYYMYGFTITVDDGTHNDG